MHLTDWLIDLHGHKRRVGYIEWHPTAENVLVSAGFDHLVGKALCINLFLALNLFYELLFKMISLCYSDDCVGHWSRRGHDRD